MVYNMLGYIVKEHCGLKDLISVGGPGGGEGSTAAP